MTDAEWADFQRKGLHLREDQRTEEQKKGLVRPTTLTYQVKGFNDEWSVVEQAVEIEGGCLRYIKDGFAMTAAAGNWRVVMDQAFQTQMEQMADAKMELAKKIEKRKVWIGIIIFICTKARFGTTSRIGD
jgi:hypothetical protein